jgi:hypothetical protein
MDLIFQTHVTDNRARAGSWEPLGAGRASESRMADLSSCYFCSAAMDVSLREYAVVPEAFEPTPRDQATVLVCGACQRKLDRVLEPVVTAAREQAKRARRDDAQRGQSNADRHGPQSGTRSQQGQQQPRDDRRQRTQHDAGGDQSGADTATPIVPSNATGDSGPRHPNQSDAEATANEAPRNDAADTQQPFDVDETASVFDDPDDTGDAADGDDATDSVFADGTTTVDSRDTGGTDASDTNLGDGIDFITDDDTDASNATDTGSSSSDTTDAADTTPDVDPNTYNKVVRLLQNRDLPTPRSEIETIASSAYDIPTLETEAIIDTAIQRGLVAERGDELVHPDDA